MTSLNRQTKKKNFRLSGFSLAEVAISSSLIIFFTMLALDLGLLIFACSVNDKACRDVVRAAAQQSNSYNAYKFAQASVRNHKTDGMFISRIQLTGLNYNDFGGNPPAGMCPYVQATTSVNVLVPLPICYFGTSFTNNIQFSQIYTSPIVKTKYILP